MSEQIDVTLLQENLDGSADYVFNLNKEQQSALLRYGIIKAIEAGIQEAKERYTPEELE